MATEQITVQTEGPFCSKLSPLELVNEALEGIDKFKEVHGFDSNDPDLEFVVETLMELESRFDPEAFEKRMEKKANVT